MLDTYRIRTSFTGVKRLLTLPAESHPGSSSQRIADRWRRWRTCSNKLGSR